MSHRQTRCDEPMWLGKSAIRAFQPVQQEIAVLRRMARFNIQRNMIRYYTLLSWQCRDSAESHSDLTGLPNLSGLLGSDEIRMSVVCQPHARPVGVPEKDGAWRASLNVFANDHHHAGLTLR